MSGLADKLRWRNRSKVTQSFMDPANGQFVRILPGQAVQGSTLLGLDKSPAFEKSLAHIGQREMFGLLKEETDPISLRNMIDVERRSSNRMAVIAMMKWTLNKLEKHGSLAGNDSDQSPQPHGTVA